MKEVEKFSLKTHHFDPKGKLFDKTPYRLHVLRGAKLFERPSGSGNVFYENGEMAGRMNYKVDEHGKVSKKYEDKAEHAAYIAPLNADEALAQESAQVRNENEALRKELDAIKAEKNKSAIKIIEAKPEASAKLIEPQAKEVSEPKNYKDLL